MVNERLGSFSTKRSRVIGLGWTLVLLLGIPCTMAANFQDHHINVLICLAAADFGNSRECSLRWMLYGAKETGAMRWVMALSKNVHHACVFFAFVLVEENIVETSRPDVQFAQVLAVGCVVEFVDHVCFLAVRLRFKVLGKVVMRLTHVLIAALIASMALPYFVDVAWLPKRTSVSAAVAELRIAGMVGFAATLVYDGLDTWGGYIRSRRTCFVEIRGRERERSPGGAEYDRELIAGKADYFVDCDSPSSSHSSHTLGPWYV